MAVNTKMTGVDGKIEYKTTSICLRMWQFPSEIYIFKRLESKIYLDKNTYLQFVDTLYTDSDVNSMYQVILGHV